MTGKDERAEFLAVLFDAACFVLQKVFFNFL